VQPDEHTTETSVLLSLGAIDDAVIAKGVRRQ